MGLRIRFQPGGKQTGVTRSNAVSGHGVQLAQHFDPRPALVTQRGNESGGGIRIQRGPHRQITLHRRQIFHGTALDHQIRR